MRWGPVRGQDFNVLSAFAAMSSIASRLGRQRAIFAIGDSGASPIT
jgi:hypothetical protein